MMDAPEGREIQAENGNSDFGFWIWIHHHPPMTPVRGKTIIRVHPRNPRNP